MQFRSPPPSISNRPTCFSFSACSGTFMIPASHLNAVSGENKVMADDAEFRSAMLTFLRARREAEEGFCVNDEDFEEYVDFALNSKTGVAEWFRVFYGNRRPVSHFRGDFPARCSEAHTDPLNPLLAPLRRTNRLFL